MARTPRFGIVVMLHYRKRQFDHAHALLRRVTAHRGELGALKELQQLLFGEMVRAERQIRLLKQQLRTFGNELSVAAERKSMALARRIEGLRYCRYIWRSFGDAIAFAYFDRFALKHLLYNTDNVNQRQDSGFICDKHGAATEISVLESAFEHGVPALLTDLTNTIRHGDICLMGGSDPHLIEVKSSDKLNKRGKQQKRNLEKLHHFYETDKSRDFRGAEVVHRVAFDEPIRTHCTQLDDCISDALRNGWAARHPEAGLQYVAATSQGLKGKRPSCLLTGKTLRVFPLNEWKATQQWQPYVPFLLTIEDRDALWAFVQGKVIISVILDLDQLRRIAIEKGCEAEIDLTDAHYPMRLKVPGAESMTRVSDHLICRIGFEFVSPEWIVDWSIRAITRGHELSVQEG